MSVLLLTQGKAHVNTGTHGFRVTQGTRGMHGLLYITAINGPA